MVVFKRREFQLNPIPISLPFVEEEGAAPVQHRYQMFVGVEPRRTRATKSDLATAIEFNLIAIAETAKQTAEHILKRPLDRESHLTLLTAVSSNVADAELASHPIHRAKVRIVPEIEDKDIQGARSNHRAPNLIERALQPITDRLGQLAYNLRFENAQRERAAAAALQPTPRPASTLVEIPERAGELVGHR